MKRFILLTAVILSLVFAFSVSQAAQVTCSGTEATVWAGAPVGMQMPSSICYQNFDASNTVYLDTVKTLTTGTAGIKLPPTGGICIDNTTTAVYCITSGSSVKVGITIFYGR
jgi:hypothetical protein